MLDTVYKLLSVIIFPVYVIIAIVLSAAYRICFDEKEQRIIILNHMKNIKEKNNDTYIVR